MSIPWRSKMRYPQPAPRPTHWAVNVLKALAVGAGVGLAAAFLFWSAR